MQISETTFKKLPDQLKHLFTKLPNPGSDEVLRAFPQAKGQQGAITGSDEVLRAFPQAKGQQGAITGSEPSSKTANTFGEFAGRASSEPRGDTGSAARFFYVAKVSRRERNEGLPDGMTNIHPTLKPVSLMAYLCRLVTPPGGVVLDPFMGSGSTGKAALREGFGFIGCEMDAAYFAIAEARLAALKAAT